MTALMIEDFCSSATLDTVAMAAVNGGLNAVVNNSQQANQSIVSGYGPIFAVNHPVSAASTVLTETNPVTQVDLHQFNLINAFGNSLFTA